MRLEKASTSILMNWLCEMGKRERAYGNRGQSAQTSASQPWGKCEREYGPKQSRAVKDFIKHRIFGIVGLNRTDVGNPEPEGVLPFSIGRPVTDSSISLAPSGLFGTQDSPLFILLSRNHSCFASPMHLKHTHNAVRRVGFGR